MEEKFQSLLLFYKRFMLNPPENLSQSFWRFLGSNAEPVGSHHSRLVRHFYFPDTINKESEMMPMKKITFNAPLNHKAYSYEPMKIEVEKVIPLYGKRFEQILFMMHCTPCCIVLFVQICNFHLLYHNCPQKSSLNADRRGLTLNGMHSGRCFSNANSSNCDRISLPASLGAVITLSTFR